MNCKKIRKLEKHSTTKRKYNFYYSIKKRIHSIIKSSCLTNNCVCLRNYDNYCGLFKVNGYKYFHDVDVYSNYDINTNMSNKNEEKISEEEKPKNSGGGCCFCKKKRSETVSGSGTLKAEEAIMFQTRPQPQPYYYSPPPANAAPTSSHYNERRISPIFKKTSIQPTYVQSPTPYNKLISPKSSLEHYRRLSTPPTPVVTQRPPAPVPISAIPLSRPSQPPPPPPPQLSPPPPPSLPLPLPLPTYPPSQTIARRPSPSSTSSHPQTISQQQLRRHEQATLNHLPIQPQGYQSMHKPPSFQPPTENIRESQQPMYRNAPLPPLSRPVPQPQELPQHAIAHHYQKEEFFTKVTTEKSIKSPSSQPVQTYGGSTTALSEEEISEPKNGCCASKNKVKGPGAIHAQIHGYKVEGHVNVKGKFNQNTISIPEDSYLITK